MVRFNRVGGTTLGAPSAVTTELAPSARTHMGGPGYTRDTRSELFLLAVTYIPGEDTHHEVGAARDTRFGSLIREIAVEDPEWGARFLRFLRNDTVMRSAAVAGAAEFAKARVEAGVSGWTRSVVDLVCQRADEPGEFLAYWDTNFGLPFPKPVKRGLSDAVWRLYSEWGVLKYDTPGHAWRFADVIGVVRPTGSLRDTAGSKPVKGTWRADLYEYLCRCRRGTTVGIPERLGMLRRHAELMATPVHARRNYLDPDTLRAAGMTRESLAGWLQGPMDAAAYEAIIPSMGYTALLRNLRNFDHTGVSDAVAAGVCGVLGSPTNVTKSRVMPLQVLAAYREAPSLRWVWALEQALTCSLGNVPELGGRTLVLVDTSSSMWDDLSERSTLARWDAAATFGIALGSRCAHADVVSFSSARRSYFDPPGERSAQFILRPGESLLTAVQRWETSGYFLGGGTDTALAVRAHFTDHDRVVILTDEQAADNEVEVSATVPRGVPLYTLNLAGYQHGHSPAGARNRHTFGGLNDQMFTVMRLVEAGQRADWDAVFGPWV